jgi:hypothetical protein
MALRDVNLASGRRNWFFRVFLNVKYPIHEAAAVLPMLPGPELKKLAKDIKRRGLINPILLFQGAVLDGRNRLAACKMAGVEPLYRMVDPELDARGISPLEFVVSLNLRRRHLSASQQAMSAAAALPQWLKKTRAISNANLRNGGRLSGRAKMRTLGRSDLRLAKLFGISPRYISAAAQLRRQQPVLADAVSCGEMTLSRAMRRARELECAAARVEEAKRIRQHRSHIDIICCDIQKLRRRCCKVQLIVTDPPYSEKDLSLWDELGKLARDSLPPGGFLAALSGLQYLDQVILRLANPDYGLKYYWTACLAFEGKHGTRRPLKVVTSWRPVLIWFKPPFQSPARQVLDRFKVSEPTLKQHRWEQKPDAFAPLIENFSLVGDWVLDPFVGSGAVLQACQQLGRNAIGADIDPDAVALVERRFHLKRQ